jgi:hypothetical protein
MVKMRWQHNLKQSASNTIPPEWNSVTAIKVIALRNLVFMISTVLFPPKFLLDFAGSLSARLGLRHRRNKKIEIRRVDVTDSKNAKVWGGSGINRKTRMVTRQRIENGAVRSLRQEDGNPVLVDGEEKQRSGLTVEIGKIGTLESGVEGQRYRVGQIEAERKTALKPGFDGVAIR